MTEKVIHEVRFIETDDGYRIEVKGDKEAIREMGFNPRMMKRMFRHHHRGHGGWGMGCGPGARFARHFGWWSRWMDDDEQDTADTAEKGEPHGEPSAQK
jgi:hypothetical protein